jgi:L-lactate dehydrogenase complex protein LldG
MASSRDVVLAALRRGAIGAGEPAQLAGLGVRYADPLARFEQSLAAAGGECRRIAPGVALAESLRALPRFTAARRILSGVAEVASVHPDAEPSEPRDLADLDLAILPGSPAVAENGAVWLSPRDSLERAACFLAEHVILVVPRDRRVRLLRRGPLEDRRHRAVPGDRRPRPAIAHGPAAGLSRGADRVWRPPHLHSRRELELASGSVGRLILAPAAGGAGIRHPSHSP